MLDRLLDEIEEFITGAYHRPAPDRVLATVMFTDIVGSTEHAAHLGDLRWRDLLNDYCTAVRKELTAFCGREVNTSGDAVLATFDGPRPSDTLCPLGARQGSPAAPARPYRPRHGIAVHIGARVAATADPDEVIVSSTASDLPTPL